MIQKSLTVSAILITVLFLSLTALAIWGGMEFSKEGPLKSDKIIDISPGSSIAAIASELDRKGVIDNTFIFEMAARYLTKKTPLQAGEYLFHANISIKDVISRLQKGDVYLHQITIPEGFTNYQIKRILESHKALSGKIHDMPPEGYLMPETYFFHKGVERQKMVERMHQAKKDFLESLWDNSPKDLPIQTKHELVTLASIVEKETGLAKERAKVAGVFINRLQKNMRLQSDPTVIYALTAGVPEDKGKGPLGRRLLRKDLQFASPYNTYLYAGLPPGPICNPGKGSLKAVINPVFHDYIYFVADGAGGHVFSKTLKEHNKNVVKWRKIRRLKSTP